MSIKPQKAPMPFVVQKDGVIVVEDEFLKDFILKAQESLSSAEILAAVNSPEMLMPAVEAIDAAMERGAEFRAQVAANESGLMDAVVEQMGSVVEAMDVVEMMQAR